MFDKPQSTLHAGCGDRERPMGSGHRGWGGVHSCGGSFRGCLCLKEDAFKDVQDPVSASRGSMDGGQRDQGMHNQKLAPQAREWEVS